MGPNSRSITRFNCHAAVCLPDKILKCLRSQEATGRDWIGLEQNIIDTAVSEWRKRLLACVHIVGKHFKHILLQAVEK